MSSMPAVRPIDPLRPNEIPGRYADDLVVVGPDLLADGMHTRHFTFAERDGRLHVGHRLAPPQIDDDLAELLSDELFAPGWVVGGHLFERILTGIVLSAGPDPLASWELFYRNTLSRSAGYGPVYERATALTGPGSVLDVGCCFGFLALRLAARGDTSVIASDVSAGTVGLLAAVAPRLGLPVDTLAADAARVPLPDACVDTVTAVHLLEHLEPGHGAAVVTEALRLARRRVVIAVPFEDEPNAAFGHVRTFDLPELDRLGRATGVPYRVEDHHGGWLILSPAPSSLGG